jgi:8-oxo-dGTP diphosphatase
VARRQAQAVASLDVSAAGNTVEAAGGVVTRRGEHGEVEVLVVHRPRYDDWSLPKGKLEPGETFEDAAAREVEEETGVRVQLGDELPAQRYLDRKGRDKLVRYWMMTPMGASAWTANDEVDQVRWVRAGEAQTFLTYDADRSLVATVAAAEASNDDLPGAPRQSR